MTFSNWVKKNSNKLTNVSKLTLNDWINNRNLPDWKERNNILWNNHCSDDIKDEDGFTFTGNKAGKNTKFDINNKMQYYRSATWQKVMARKIKSTGGKCEICGSKDNLTVHHREYTANWGGKESDDELLTCCKRCHMLQHKDKPECVKQYNELMSPIRSIVINVKSDGSITPHVFTNCDDDMIRAYMVDMYKKAKVIKYIKNCRLYKTKLEGEPNKANDRWFAISINNKNEVVELHQCNSKKEAEKYKKKNLKNFVVFKPSKTIDSEKLNQIYHPKKK